MQSLREAPDRVVGLLKGFINEVGELTFVPDRLRPDRTARRTAKEMAVALRVEHRRLMHGPTSTPATSGRGDVQRLASAYQWS